MIAYILKFKLEKKIMYLQEIRKDNSSKMIGFTEKIEEAKKFSHRRELEHFIKENFQLLIDCSKFFDKYNIVKVEFKG